MNINSTKTVTRPTLSVTHAIWVSERTIWPSEKTALMMSEERGTRSVGERPARWQARPGQARQDTHTHTLSLATAESRVKHSVHATIYNTSITQREKDKLDLFHIFLLSGTDWLQVLSNHVDNVESLFNAHATLAWSILCVCVETTGHGVVSAALMLPFVWLWDWHNCMDEYEIKPERDYTHFVFCGVSHFIIFDVNGQVVQVFAVKDNPHWQSFFKAKPAVSYPSCVKVASPLRSSSRHLNGCLLRSQK